MYVVTAVGWAVSVMVMTVTKLVVSIGLSGTPEPDCWFDAVVGDTHWEYQGLC